jgi:tetratricopeptide (TPR) repeat protein
MWINMLLLALQMMGVTWIGNTNAVFHYRMKVEGYLLEGKYDKALKVGQKSLESDENLLMLRMAAMARQGVLGEHLFEYPITGNSSQMLPTNGQTAMILCPADSLYKFLGAKPGESLEPQRYLELLQRRDSVPEKVIADYLLCGYLIDKKIDQFAQAITQYYQIDAHLPKHYKEALTLYTHLRSQPVVTYHVPEVEEDFSNLQELEKQYPDAQERKVKVSEQYRGTYWYYYRYE